MPINIEAQGSNFSFPDGTPQAEIQSALDSHFAPPFFTEDFSKTIPSAAAKGVIAANPLVAVPTLSDLAIRGTGWAARHAPESIVSPEAAKDIQSGVDTIHQKLSPF